MTGGAEGAKGDKNSDEDAAAPSDGEAQVMLAKLSQLARKRAASDLTLRVSIGVKQLLSASSTTVSKRLSTSNAP